MLAWCITVRIVWKNSRFNEKNFVDAPDYAVYLLWGLWNL